MPVPPDFQAMGPLDALWRPRALGWLILLVIGLGLILALALVSPGEDATAYFETFGLFTLLGAWVALLTLATLYWLRRPLAALATGHVAWFALALLVGFTGVLCLLSHALLPGISGAWSRQALVMRAMGIAAIVGLLSLGGFHAIWRNLQLQWRAQRSELAALQARTRPHFLFNTLNAATALVRQQPEAAETLLLDLSDLLRAAVAAPQEWSLGEEVALTRKYLDIERLRFGERLRVEWNLPDPLPAVRLPMLSLQPLVENAVLHGIERRTQGGCLAIDLQIDAKIVTLKVSNDLGDATTPPHIGHHVGVEAVRERLREFTGGRGTLQLRQLDGQFEAVLTLPRDQPATTS